MYCRINGYWKDDKTEFNDLLVREYDDTPNTSEEFEDDDIFYYGMSEEQIIKEIKNGEDTSLDFVIVSHEKV